MLERPVLTHWHAQVPVPRLADERVVPHTRGAHCGGSAGTREPKRPRDEGVETVPVCGGIHGREDLVILRTGKLWIAHGGHICSICPPHQKFRIHIIRDNAAGYSEWFCCHHRHQSGMLCSSPLSPACSPFILVDPIMLTRPQNSRTIVSSLCWIPAIVACFMQLCIPYTPKHRVAHLVGIYLASAFGRCAQCDLITIDLT